jgi:signal transduction histidine kinase
MGLPKDIWIPAMSHLTLVSTDLPQRPAHASQSANHLVAQDLVAHDLRNLLATIGLHLETLQRLSGPSGAKAADAAHALLTRGAALCNQALDRAANADTRVRRRGADPAQIARHVADLLAPSAPKGFSFQIDREGAGCVLADADEVFRILFNLMSNAIAVANRKANPLTTVTIRISTDGASVTTRVTDDGPGLPASVRAGLFTTQSCHSTTPRHGYGLAIARELSERNGGTLTLAPSTKGASFALTLPALLSVLPQDRSLGRRAMTV